MCGGGARPAPGRSRPSRCAASGTRAGLVARRWCGADRVGRRVPGPVPPYLARWTLIPDDQSESPEIPALVLVPSHIRMYRRAFLAIHAGGESDEAHRDDRAERIRRARVAALAR